MKKNTLLYILLLFLVAANGYFLYHQFGGKGKRGHKGTHRGPVEFIIKKLEFSEAQIVQFQEINEGHREKMKVISTEAKTIKEDLFDQLSSESLDQIKIDSLINVIGVKEKEKETEVFFHLRAIRDLCNDEQKKRFERIMKDIIHKRSKRGGTSGSKF